MVWPICWQTSVPVSIVPTARKLEDEPTRDQAEVLLKSLGWIEAPQDVAAILRQNLGKTLEKYLSDVDADIRAAACAATRILPREQAIALLARQRASESDPRVLNPSTKLASAKTASDSPGLIWRKIRGNRWVGKSADCAADVDGAAQDFQLRERDDYLSFFVVSNRDDGRQVAAAFAMVGHGRPDRVDFLLFPREFLTDAGIDVTQKPLPGQHPFLSFRHWGTVGPRHEPDEEFIKRLLSKHSVEVIEMTKKEVVAAAKRLLIEFPDFENYLGQHWSKQLRNK